MDLYSEKSNLKFIILLLGTFVGLSTLLYTNHIANQMADEEQYKAKLWAEAIVRKAKLVRYTKELFGKLAEDERKKVNIYAQSTKFILSYDNNDLPAILVDQDGTITGARNIEIPKVKTFDELPVDIRNAFSIYPPILVNTKVSKSYIYYKDSNFFTKLRQTLNDLVETFISDVVLNTASAPVIITDEKMRILDVGNIDSTVIRDSAALQQRMIKMQSANEPVEADLGEGSLRYIYYDDSSTLKQLRFFPYVQLGIFAVFLLIAYLAVSSSLRSEQNMVWVGMAKETAHQLGTPISSLEGWVEYLRDVEGIKDKPEILTELENDINRLSLVAERFSKIGSVPQLKPENVLNILDRDVSYMRRRASEKVTMTLNCPPDLRFLINHQLFDWVIENLLKNALDAMDGEGKISIEAFAHENDVIIEVTDSGKGIPKSKFSTIFEPGYSTKRRGWGLGLSLTKRIVEQYHKGKIFVKHSELGKGTTFRIVVPKA